MRSRYMRAVTGMLAAAFVCALCACARPHAPVYEREGRVYGRVDGVFTDMWYDYYLRALSYADGRYWEDAVADLREAIALRDDDRRRARTYGMHFLDYFPNRELGVCYYHTGDYRAAVGALEASLASFATAKARLYLNMSRKKLLEQTGGDTRPPVLTITSPAGPAVTRDRFITVSGTARDDTYVSAIRCNGDAETLALARPAHRFSRRVALQPGANIIRVRAEDLLGRLSPPAAIEVVSDREGPLVSLAAHAGASGDIRLRVAAYDASAVTRITLAGRDLSVSPARFVTIDNEPVSRRLFGPEGHLRLQVEDRAGNITVAEVCLPGTGAGARTRLPLLARAGAGLPPMSLPGAADRDLAVEITGIEDGREVFLKEVFVEGYVRAPRGIRSISVNGIPLVDSGGDESLAAFLRECAGSKQKGLYFSRIVSLSEGENRITIRAEDRSGEYVQRVLRIVRTVPTVHRVSMRLGVAVYPFEEKRSPAGPVSDYVYTNLLHSLVRQRRFNVLEREAIEQLLLEQQMSMRKVFDQKTSARLGKLLAADAVMVGEIYAAENRVEIVVRMVDTETSVVLAENDAYWEKAVSVELDEVINGLALKFNQDFPLREGSIVDMRSGSAVCDLGSSVLRRGMKLVVFREGEPVIHPVTGKSLGAPTEELGVVRADEIYDDFSLAEVIKTFGPDAVSSGQLVIVK